MGLRKYEQASGGDGIPAELFQILKDDAVKVLHSICQQIWKIQQWPQDWKSSVFILIPKKGNDKECSNYHTIALSSDIVQETGIKTILMENKCKKAKWLSEEALQIAVKRKEAKSKGKRKDIPI